MICVLVQNFIQKKILTCEVLECLTSGNGLEIKGEKLKIRFINH